VCLSVGQCKVEHSEVTQYLGEHQNALEEVDGDREDNKVRLEFTKALSRYRKALLAVPLKVPQ
jgi:hypothetical protein